MKVEMNFVKCMDEAPKADGDYSVMTVHSENYFYGTMKFTVDGGWNTRYTYAGELDTSHRINFESDPEAYWAKSIVITEDDDE